MTLENWNPANGCKMFNMLRCCKISILSFMITQNERNVIMVSRENEPKLLFWKPIAKLIGDTFSSTHQQEDRLTVKVERYRERVLMLKMYELEMKFL